MEPSVSEEACLVSNAPAIVGWHCDDNGPSFLGFKTPDTGSQATLNIRSLPNENAASINLRVPIGLKSVAKRVPLFLMIPLEHILILERIERLSDSEVPESVRTILVRDGMCSSHEDIMRLELRLAQPPTAIVPKHIPLITRTKGSSSVLQSLRRLARATSLTIYLPHNGVMQDELDTVCRNARDGAMKSILATTRLQALYGGKGAKEMELGTPPPESPPSYDEIAELPPSRRPRSKSTRDEEPSAKRPRQSRSDAEVPKDWKSGVEQQLEVLNKTVETVRNQVESLEKRPEVSDQLGALRDQLKCVEQTMALLRTQVEQTEQRLRKQLVDIKAEMQQALDDRFDILENELEDKMNSLQDDFGEIADVHIDDRLMLFKEELSEHVDDEVRMARRSLRRSVSRASLWIELSEDE